MSRINLNLDDIECAKLKKRLKQGKFTKYINNLITQDNNEYQKINHSDFIEVELKTELIKWSTKADETKKQIKELTDKLPFYEDQVNTFGLKLSEHRKKVDKKLNTNLS